jgi:hypothetical protein
MAAIDMYPSKQKFALFIVEIINNVKKGLICSVVNIFWLNFYQTGMTLSLSFRKAKRK